MGSVSPFCGGQKYGVSFCFLWRSEVQGQLLLPVEVRNMESATLFYEVRNMGSVIVFYGGQKYGVSYSFL